MRNIVRGALAGRQPRLPQSGVALASHTFVECWIGIAQESDRRVVKLAGRLSVAQVPELLNACSLPLELDLSDLVSADSSGIEALQRLRSMGATLVHVPGYLQLKLDSPSGGLAPVPDRPIKGRSGR